MKENKSLKFCIFPIRLSHIFGYQKEGMDALILIKHTGAPQKRKW